MIGITVLGATGSIGISTLDVLSQHQDRYQVLALTANTQVDKMLALVHQHQPKYVVMTDPDAAEKLELSLRSAAMSVVVLSGVAGLEQVSVLDEVTVVMAAIVGGAGLLPTLAAVKAGKRVLLANKEALVMSGSVLMNAAQESGAVLLPVDSEHNAIFQCLPEHYADGLAHVGVKRLLLTASGGPLRNLSASELHEVTPDQACAHPNWVMGRKISVDSASMMNKGLEVIEACWLFNTSVDTIKVVIHPQSVIHSMVEYVDGSILAQLGSPDMRTPIAHALAWPERIAAGVRPLDLFDVARLDFEPPDLGRFPCLRLACEVAKQGGTATTILNAANEVAVAAFLEGTIRFTHLPKIIEQTLEAVSSTAAQTLAEILSADELARQAATRYITTVD